MNRITAPGIACDCDDCISIYGYNDKSRQQFYDDIAEEIVLDEGSFSWHSCDICNSSLGGTRFAAHSFIPGVDDNELEHLEICTDCLLSL